MANTYFAWLGSKRAVKNNVSEKGARLDIAVRRGLPVPNGGVLLDDFYLLCLQEKVAIEASNRVVVPQAEALFDLLYTAVRFPRLAKPCALRPLFEVTTSPHLNVDVNDPIILAAALAQLWTAVLPCGPEARRDVLIQEMVAVEKGGTAVTSLSSQVDAITSNGTSITLPKLSRWQKPAANVPPHAQRLQKLLAGVRRTFGAAGWQISWADDGRDTWLLQVTAVA
jgi:hypothetical protein